MIMFVKHLCIRNNNNIIFTDINKRSKHNVDTNHSDCRWKKKNITDNVLKQLRQQLKLTSISFKTFIMTIYIYHFRETKSKFKFNSAKHSPNLQQWCTD